MSIVSKTLSYRLTLLFQALGSPSLSPHQGHPIHFRFSLPSERTPNIVVSGGDPRDDIFRGCSTEKPGRPSKWVVSLRGLGRQEVFGYEGKWDDSELGWRQSFPHWFPNVYKRAPVSPYRATGLGGQVSYPSFHQNGSTLIAFICWSAM